MVANLVILAFLMGMSYWWSIQGLLSALLHLGLVIVAGAIAFAVWEPVAYALIDVIPDLAWGVALLAPFAIVLIVLRLTADKLVPMNMQFMGIISKSAGGFLGVLSGILTAGIMVIGISHLPIGTTVAGYQPYALTVRMSGEAQLLDVDEGGTGLWAPVDKVAAEFFTGLSSGAFYPWSGTTMREYTPDLRFQAAMYHLSFDPNASLSANPDHVRVDKLYVHPTPMLELADDVAAKLGEQATAEGNQIVVVDTVWKSGKGTYESNQTAYIPPTQVSLVTESVSGQRRKYELHTPVGYVFIQMAGDEEYRTIIPFDDDGVSAHATEVEEKIGWVFITSANQTPRFINIKRLRMELPSPEREEPAVAMAVGVPVHVPEPEQTADATTPESSSEVGARQGPVTEHVGVQIEVTNRLPSFISRNMAQGLQYNEQDHTIVSGDTIARKPPTGTGQRNRFDQISTPSHKEMVRLQIVRSEAQSLLGRTIAMAASIGGVFLVDENGQRYEPIGYVWPKSNGEMRIKIDPVNPIRAASQLPVPDMTGDESIYLYFMVNPGTTITSYEIGSRTFQEVNLVVEKQQR